MKLITVVGARPQFVKAAAVSRAIATQGCAINEIMVHTGQHFDENMSAVFFDELTIPRPSYNLGINSLNHGAMTGRMLEKLESILLDEKPGAVMVYGDTNSTLAGALAARKLHIPVIHVEAGLRSFNMQMPEEINRILTDRISNILCCPTEAAVNNLYREGLGNDQKIIRTGDVMLDAVHYYRKLAATKSPILDRLTLQKSAFALCTVHRAENTESPDRLNSIMTALETIAADIEIVLPLHPRTKNRLTDLKTVPSRLTIIEPVGYLDMLQLLDSANIVITDSGGLQKEAFFFRKPCITLRNETEWTELVDGGYNMLAGVDTNSILLAFQQMQNTRPDFGADLYGNGNASGIIIQELLQLNETQKKENMRATT